MRILFLSEQFPYPLHDGGNLRTYHILRGLALEHDVHLVAHEPPVEHAEVGIKTLSSFCNMTLQREAAPWRRLVVNSLRRGTRWPGFVLKNWSEPLLRAADDLLANEHFDAIHLNMLDTACFALARTWSQPKVFDSHNCLWSMAAQVAQGASYPKRFFYRREQKMLQLVERAVCQGVDNTLVCSEQDTTLFQELGVDSQFTFVPNGVDTTYFNPVVRDGEPGRLVFTGSMNYFPNEQAACYFVERILPLLQTEAATVQVCFVGARPTRRVQALHDGRRVLVTGCVDDVRPYVHSAQVFVVPLLTGGGTRLKILEAFAMGKAVVSTSKGAEGIEAEHEKHLLIADEPREFATQVQRLLADRGLRRRLGEEARRFVVSRFSWEQVHRIVLETYPSLCLKNPSTSEVP